MGQLSNFPDTEGDLPFQSKFFGRLLFKKEKAQMHI